MPAVPRMIENTAQGARNVDINSVVAKGELHNLVRLKEIIVIYHLSSIHLNNRYRTS